MADALADFFKEIEEVDAVTEVEATTDEVAAPKDVGVTEQPQPPRGAPASGPAAAASEPKAAEAAAPAPAEKRPAEPLVAVAKPAGPIAIAPGVFKFEEEDEDDEACLVPGAPPAKRAKLSATSVVPRALLTKTAAPAPAPVFAPRTALSAGTSSSSSSSSRPMPSSGALPGHHGLQHPAPMLGGIAPPVGFIGMGGVPASGAVPPAAAPVEVDRKTAAAMGLLRTCAGETWVDTTLAEWPKNDFRLFVGDIGNDVTDEILAAAFKSRFPSFAKARVVRDHRDGKTRGFGFVSLLEASDALAALKTMGGAYVGARPITIRRANVGEKDYSAVVSKEKEAAKAAAAAAGVDADGPGVRVADLVGVAKHMDRDRKLRH